MGYWVLFYWVGRICSSPAGELLSRFRQEQRTSALTPRVGGRGLLVSPSAIESLPVGEFTSERACCRRRARPTAMTAATKRCGETEVHVSHEGSSPHMGVRDLRRARHSFGASRIVDAVEAASAVLAAASSMFQAAHEVDSTVPAVVEFVSVVHNFLSSC